MNRYKNARIRAGLSQKAAAISLGVRQPSISDWEHGKSHPKHAHLVAMAELYNTTTDYLTGAEETKEKQPAISDDELKELTIERINRLPAPLLEKLLDLIEEIQPHQGTDSAAPAEPGPCSGSAL